MNKQYVKEQIDIAIRELEKKYDSVIGNIYQCPDCGAAAFKNGEHICFRAAPAPAEQPAKPKKVPLYQRVFEVVPVGEPSLEVVPVDSQYNPHMIAHEMIAAGFTDSAGAVKGALSDLWEAKRLCRKLASVRSPGGVRAGGLPGYVYWRSA